MDKSFVERVSWDEVNEYLNRVVSLVSSKDHSGVYGIPRGGSVLAAWLSHKLYIPLQPAPDKNSIIIDDICNSGDELSVCLNVYHVSGENYFITTMYKGKEAPDDLIHFAHRVKGEKWIAFPWEQ